MVLLSQLKADLSSRPQSTSISKVGASHHAVAAGRCGAEAVASREAACAHPWEPVDHEILQTTSATAAGRAPAWLAPEEARAPQNFCRGGGQHARASCAAVRISANLRRTNGGESISDGSKQQLG